MLYLSEIALTAIYMLVSVNGVDLSRELSLPTGTIGIVLLLLSVFVLAYSAKTNVDKISKYFLLSVYLIIQVIYLFVGMY